MDVTRTRNIKLNLGNYEHWEDFFRVTVSTDDLTLSGIDLEGTSMEKVALILTNFAEEELDKQTLTFIQKVSNITACQESAALDPDFAKTFTPASPTPTKTTRRS